MQPSIFTKLLKIPNITEDSFFLTYFCASRETYGTF